jgi:hypothetical protein
MAVTEAAAAVQKIQVRRSQPACEATDEIIEVAAIW